MSYVLSKTGEVLQGWKIGLQYLDHETAFTVTYLSLIFKITTNMLKKKEAMVNINIVNIVNMNAT